MDVRRASLWASLYMWLAFVALLLLTMVANAKTMCQAEPISPTEWWAWRMIDGKQCWYAGKPKRPKEELYWPAPEPPAILPNPPPWRQEHRWFGGQL